MLDINYIEENKEAVIQRLASRQITQAKTLVEEAIGINQERKKTQLGYDTAACKANQLTKEIAQLITSGQSDTAASLKLQYKDLKTSIKELELQLQQHQKALQAILYEIPNLPHKNVPLGKNEQDNKVIYQVESLPVADKNTLPHWDLIEKYNIIDFKLGNQLAGAGFPVYRGKGARLQRGLINFFLDEARKAGFEEIQPPIVANTASVYATGQLPDKEGQMYQLTDETLYLIPTAETPITNLYRGKTLLERQLPIQHVAYTPCFRREAGSWGKHVRGLNRLHQFDKVEIVVLTLPQLSYHQLEWMLNYIVELVKKLGLPYRILSLCTGDIGFNAAYTYDIEVFSVGQNRWLEVSSISNFETYQTNRMQTRYKDQQGNTHLLHTLNGSALALPRIIAALLEINYDGNKIKMPEILKKYLDFDFIS